MSQMEILYAEFNKTIDSDQILHGLNAPSLWNYFSTRLAYNEPFERKIIYLELHSSNLEKIPSVVGTT